MFLSLLVHPLAWGERIRPGPLEETVEERDECAAFDEGAIKALSFLLGPLGRRYINYHDLGVRQLGLICKRLLERELVPEGDGLAIQPSPFAR